MWAQHTKYLKWIVSIDQNFDINHKKLNLNHLLQKLMKFKKKRKNCFQKSQFKPIVYTTTWKFVHNKSKKKHKNEHFYNFSA